MSKKTDKTEEKQVPCKNLVTPLTRLMDGSQVRTGDIRAIRVHKREDLSGGDMFIPDRITISMDRNIGDICINFNNYIQAQEYAAEIADIVNEAAG